MKRQSLYVLTLSVVALAGCQNNDIAGLQDLNDGTVRYAVSFGDALQTRAAVLDAETPLALSDKEGKLVIPMGFEVSEGISLELDTVLTRGTQVNTGGDDSALGSFSDVVSGFTVKAYNGDGVEKLFQSVSWSGTAWTATPVAYWPQATILNFLAYANMPLDQSATIASTGVSTEHTVPATASQQKDILFGYYQGNGGNTGTAEIRFNHPLTAVRFKYGEMDGNPTIKRISLSGVAPSGTATMIQDGSIAWSEIDSHNGIVSQENLSGLPVNATTSVIGEPFLIIPQNVATLNVKVMVTFTDDTVLEGILNTGAWKAGYTNTYTIGYKDEWEYHIEGMTPVTVDFHGGSSAMTVKSYRVRKNDASQVESASWNLEYSTDGINWSTTKPSWLTFNNTSGSGGTSGESLSVTVAAQSGVSGGSAPAKDGHDVNLRNASPKGGNSLADRFDLSYFNVATGQVTATRSTANTYVVNSSGYYKIPLVYGNAIKNGSANTAAYSAPAPSEPGTYTHYLQNFVNHADKPISDPWIKNGLNSNNTSIGTNLNACIVWQDANNLVSNVAINGDYLTFDVANATITQGNCMVAVRNSSNTILWSWQIWVTDENLAETNRVTISGRQYDFMKVLLGWYSTGNAPVTTYAGRSCYVRANNGHVTSNTTFAQAEHEDVALSTRGSCTMYQWGRKDPFPGGDGEFTNQFRGLYQNTYNAEWCSPSRIQLVSVGEAIQKPYYMNAYYNVDNGFFMDWTTNWYTNLWSAMVHISDQNININGYDFGQHKSVSTIKTIYDPSPVGFTLPNGEAYDGIVRQESGTYHYDSGGHGFLYESGTGNIFFPCCGYRNMAYLTQVSATYYWYDTDGFSVWSNSPSHANTSFVIQYDPTDGNCAGERITMSNSNNSYTMGVALIKE
ncbi:MAG: fimbrillin family protein [Bacteroidaceae bacterium]|nr:fimbrillin family protein [Bacteroidaceae bacterium]